MVVAPAIDGITNALVLVRIGYLTKERCRSFRQWDTKAQQSALIKALAATQKVALGLTGEILRKVGTGLGVLTEAAARGVSQAADAAGKAIGSTAESALKAMTDFGEKVAGLFGRKAPDEKEG